MTCARCGQPFMNDNNASDTTVHATPDICIVRLLRALLEKPSLIGVMSSTSGFGAPPVKRGPGRPRKVRP